MAELSKSSPSPLATFSPSPEWGRDSIRRGPGAPGLALNEFSGIAGFGVFFCLRSSITNFHYQCLSSSEPLKTLNCSLGSCLISHLFSVSSLCRAGKVGNFSLNDLGMCEGWQTLEKASEHNQSNCNHLGSFERNVCVSVVRHHHSIPSSTCGFRSSSETSLKISGQSQPFFSSVFSKFLVLFLLNPLRLNILF